MNSNKFETELAEYRKSVELRAKELGVPIGEIYRIDLDLCLSQLPLIGKKGRLQIRKSNWGREETKH